jgi:anti-sigma factor RsiW
VSRVPPPVTEEDLHALVDGETDPARRDAIFGFLSGSPADAAKIDAWRRQNEAIRAWFARVEAEPFDISSALAPATSQGIPGKAPAAQIYSAQAEKADRFWFSGKHRTWRDSTAWRNLTGALFAAFLCGNGAAFGLIMLLNHSRLGGWPGEGPAGVEEETSFINRTKAALLEFAPGGEAAVARQGASPAALILPNLSGTGLRLTGVRIVPGEKDRMICLFYTKGATGVIALCAEAKADGDRPGFHEEDQSNRKTVWWTQNHAKYALSGALPAAELRSLANHARNEIEAFDAR